MDYENQTILDVDIEKEMRGSFLDYSMSVIVQRALPDVRDGLKPVHRRILYSMYNSGLTHEKPYSKSAATVGDVLKYFHPHGEVAVYDSLVRLAQDFSMRYPLVDGHGNFGSVDGDGAAAQRYTEARLSRISAEMMSDIERDTVDFRPNYDGRYKEPSVLPARVPNLLLNGSTGIAVGMATNIPPHNFGEIADAINLLIDEPEATTEEILRIVKGPDFPTGGIIVGRAGIRAAYATGRGQVKVRSKAEIEEIPGGRFQIVVSEIPYMVNKVRLVEQMAALVKDKRVDGIASISDHSDRKGLRIVIELRREANPQVVLNRLYNFTSLQDTFSVIMLALSGGRPKVMTLREMLTEYIEFQRGVVRRRTRFDLNRAKRRAHILEGLKIAVDNIDEIINIIRSSRTEPQAIERFAERFGLDAEQGQAILDMRMGRLTGLERDKIETELAELLEKIAELERILASDELVYGIIKSELAALRARYADERRTMIEAVESEIDIEDLIENELSVFTSTRLGYIKRMPAAAYRAQRRGGRGARGMATREEDVVDSVFAATSHSNLLFFTNMGRAFRLKGYQVPEASRGAKGTNMVNLLSLVADEKVTAILPVGEGADTTPDGRFLTFVTRQGVIKRVDVASVSNIRRVGLRVINLREDDEVIAVLLTDGLKTIILATRAGRAIRFHEGEARQMGRTAAGVRGVGLSEGDCVVGAAAVAGGELLLSVSERGYGKRTPVDEYPIKHRAGMGVINYDITEKTGPVAAIRVVTEDEDLLLITGDGQIIRTGVGDIRICRRASQGVILMRQESGIIGIAAVAREDADDADDADEDAIDADEDIGADDDGIGADTAADTAGGEGEVGGDEE